MNENKFIFQGEWYKAVSSVPGKTNCDECDLDIRKCVGSPDIPNCLSERREDHRDVYFKKIKTNFEKLIEEESSLLSGLYVDENHSVANELYHKKQINDLFSEEVSTIEPFVRIK